MHATSLNAAETANAIATAAARPARASAGAKKAAATVTAADIAINAAEVRQKVGGVEMDAREYAGRADEMGTTAITAAEQNEPQENAAEVFATVATLMKRAQAAERVVDEQRRQQAVRMVSTNCRNRNTG